MSENRNTIDSRQYPDWAEFEQKGETDTQVKPKQGEGFYFGYGDWRFKGVANILHVEHWDGTEWVEQGYFEA